jgi:hypothetical protein
MDRYKTLINSNNNRLEQYELFDAMAKNAHHLLHTLQGMRSARPRFEKVEDPDRGTKRSPEVNACHAKEKKEIATITHIELFCLLTETTAHFFLSAVSFFFEGL